MEPPETKSQANYNEVISIDISADNTLFKLILKNSSDSIVFEIFEKGEKNFSELNIKIF